MIDCPCGSILFPKGSKYDQDGLSIELIHDSGVLNFDLVHNTEAFLSNGHSFITSTPKINIDQTLNIKQIIVKCGVKFDLILKNIASTIVKVNDSNIPLAYELLGAFNKTSSFKIAGGSNEILIKIEEPYSQNLLNKKIIIEFHSLCDDITDNCCDKLPSSINIVPPSISYAPCFPTTTTTTAPPTTVTSSTTTLNPPCQNVNLPNRFKYIAVGYGSLYGQEIEVEAFKTGNTWSSTGIFPCGASFSLQMTCDLLTGKFVYDGQIDCCDQSTKYITEPSDIPYISPNARTPLIIAYTQCNCPSCTTTTTSTTPPPLPCSENIPLVINGYAFYARSNTPKNIPGVGMLNPLCFGGHRCDRTNFFPQLVTNTGILQARPISLNNSTDGGDRVASFNFSIPDSSILANGALLRLQCMNRDCHDNVTWVVMTVTIDGSTEVIFNSCVLPNKITPLSYGCRDCCKWDGNGFIEYGSNCLNNDKRTALQFTLISNNIWECKGVNSCGDFVHFVISCDPDIEHSPNEILCNTKWKVIYFSMPCATNARITNQILELCECNSPPVWLWLADDISGCECCNCSPLCTIIPNFSLHAYDTIKTHTLDACARNIVLNYQAGPSVQNNPLTSEPNRYDVYCDGVLIASTNGWVGGTNYQNDPNYQPFVGGPVGSITGIKPQGATSIQVLVRGNSASRYDISCN